MTWMGAPPLGAVDGHSDGGRDGGGVCGNEVEALSESGDDEGQLDLGEGEADAVAGSAAEGNPGCVCECGLFGCGVEVAVGIESERAASMMTSGGNR